MVRTKQIFSLVFFIIPLFSADFLFHFYNRVFVFCFLLQVDVSNVRLVTALISPQEKCALDINFLSKQYNKNISKVYVQFVYPDITFRISKNYNIFIIIKRNISQNLQSLTSFVDINCKFIEQSTGTSIGSFSFKFCNIQGLVHIPSKPISAHYDLLKTLKNSKLISSYYTTDIQNFISCTIGNQISFQIRETSIRFVVTSFRNLKQIINLAEEYFQIET